MKKNNLNTFRILFLVQGVLSLFASLIVIVYALVMMFVFTEITKHEGHLSFNPGLIFLVIGVIGFIFTATIGILNLLASKYLNEVRNSQFIFVVAIVSCLTGILLGIFTLIELGKPDVKKLFEENKL
jgi:H+/Cl- antiporter ClcA